MRPALILNSAAALLALSGAAAAPRSATAFADFLTAQGMPQAAWAELETAVALRPEAALPDGPFQRCGEELAAQGETAFAIAAFDEAAERCPDPAAGAERQVSLGALELAAGDVAAAARRLAKVERFADAAETRERAARLLAIADEAGESPSRWYGAAGGAASALLPGLGQLIGGDPAGAAGAFAANAAWAGWTAALLLAGDTGAAALVGFSLGGRYYPGNISRGAEAMRSGVALRRARVRAAALAAALASSP